MAGRAKRNRSGRSLSSYGSAVFAAALVLPALIAVMSEFVVPGNESRWALLAGCILLLGCVVGLWMVRHADNRAKKTVVGATTTVMALGAAVWMVFALGQWPYDSGFNAIGVGDYERAASAFGVAAAAHDAPGANILRLEEGVHIRMGTKGLLFYPKWDVMSWHAVALYGAGDTDAARSLMRSAIDRARADVADSAAIRNLEADLSKMTEPEVVPD